MHGAARVVSSESHITDRIIMSRAAIDGQRFRTGQLNHTEWAQVVQASADLSSFLNRVLVVNEVCGTQELTAITREVMPVGLVVVDHIHLIALTEQGDNLTTKTTHASRQLKKLAMDLEVPVLSICQFNRTVKEGEPPKLDGLRDSGALAHDAGTVLLIHSSPGERERPILIVAKNRSGPTGEITALRWHPSYASFSEVNSRELSS
ncbi:MAG: DnaB-like helicase C-terminal domain-containing protein [bacterium]|nr:DnaB-like helicase C-terminal domain-containing protein [bacterium]